VGVFDVVGPDSRKPVSKRRGSGQRPVGLSAAPPPGPAAGLAQRRAASKSHRLRGIGEGRRRVGMTSVKPRWSRRKREIGVVNVVDDVVRHADHSGIGVHQHSSRRNTTLEHPRSRCTDPRTSPRGVHRGCLLWSREEHRRGCRCTQKRQATLSGDRDRSGAVWPAIYC